jgi:hypothetical protein
MPSAGDFKKRFGLEKGLEIGDFIVEDIDCKHLAKVPLQRYEYPMHLTMKSRNSGDTKNNAAKLSQQFKKHVKNNQIVCK